MYIFMCIHSCNVSVYFMAMLYCHLSAEPLYLYTKDVWYFCYVPLSTHCQDAAVFVGAGVCLCAQAGVTESLLFSSYSGVSLNKTPNLTCDFFCHCIAVCIYSISGHIILVKRCADTKGQLVNINISHDALVLGPAAMDIELVIFHPMIKGLLLSMLPYHLLLFLLFLPPSALLAAPTIT